MQSPRTGFAALAAGASRCVRISAEGEIATLSLSEGARALEEEFHAVCGALELARRLGRKLPGLRARQGDVLDLFAFVYPARPCLPSPSGLARTMGLAVPRTLEDEAALLSEAARLLLARLARLEGGERTNAAALAGWMAEAQWPWAPLVQEALGAASGDIAVWRELPDWEEPPRRGAAKSNPVSPEDARTRLGDMLGQAREQRPAQVAYAEIAALAFAPRERSGHPHVVLAEAGTGTGKTAAYLAPASLWAEANGGAVWVSTYTRNLQRQIDQELDRLYPDPALKALKAVVRKGRENYLCLLNFQEAAARRGLLRGREAQVLGLIARWAAASRDGDLLGGDLPAFLAAEALPLGLTDRRGECVYAACPHYRKCFVERSIRRAREADIVVANHALVMTQAAHGAVSAPATDAEETQNARPRLVLDEGHHLFAAADNVFASELSGYEAAELRRWVRGVEGAERRRARGLRERLDGLSGGADEATEALLAEAVRAAGALPGAGWQSRLASGAPRGAAEHFLALVRRQVLARAQNGERDYGLECEIRPLIPGLEAAAARLAAALAALERALTGLAASLRARLDEKAGELESAARARLEALARGLEWRGRLVTAGWRAMLASLAGETPEGYVDWFAIAREQGREADTGMRRHCLDPTKPFAETVLKPSHGVLITSATLRDRGAAEEEGEDWRRAEMRTGATHLALPARRGSFASPFDYAAQTRVVVVRDVNARDMDALAAAYRELFLASGGGALGLFTAIRTLKAVQARIAGPLDAARIRLYAQHVDPYDMGLIVDMFRAEEDSCLLGTDAARDGVDVPGRSLRLIVFDRVPWPRPDILHKARRAAFGGRAYDEMLTRARFAQAFGRLIRTNKDKGVFAVLDAATPSRLLAGLPHGAQVQRMGLAGAIALTRSFLEAPALAAPETAT